MGIGELLLLAVGLSMDAFAVSLCKGLELQTLKKRHMLTAGLWFGGFQALMPLIGYLLGSRFIHQIQKFDHWIVFILLGLIGGNMIREAVSDEGATDVRQNAGLNPLSMFLLAVATSIDALAVGITLALMNVSILFSVSVIGITTFVISCAGMAIGHQFGIRYRKPSEIAGGLILIAIGSKVLIQHLAGMA